jgi:6,7-dimethyl-8-ribityllumazine synthase
MPHITTIEGQLVAKGLKFALVAGRFNDFITERLIGGAVDYLTRHGAERADLTLVKVPGAFEIPLAAKKLAASAVPGRHLPRRRHPGRHPPFRIRGQRVRQGPGPRHARNQRAVGFGVLTVTPWNRPSNAPAPRPATRAWNRPPPCSKMVRVLEQL